MASENTSSVHRWFEEVGNQGTAGAIDQMMAPDALMHGLGEAGREWNNWDTMSLIQQIGAPPVALVE